MAFAQFAFWRRDNDEPELCDCFWRRADRVGAQVPFAEGLLAAYCSAVDRNAPLQVKAVLIGAIAYFVLPTDAVFDLLPALGFADDAAVLATAVKVVASHIRPEHREAANGLPTPALMLSLRLAGTKKT